jgi:hypothetical protein
VGTGSNDVDEIYHRMAAIRRERHKHVSESVAGAEAVIDLGRYTWTYPWIALGAAAAVGYLVYTGRHPRLRASAASPADGTEAAEPVAGSSDWQRSGRWRTRTLPSLASGSPREEQCSGTSWSRNP